MTPCKMTEGDIIRLVAICQKVGVTGDFAPYEMSFEKKVWCVILPYTFISSRIKCLF